MTLVFGNLIQGFVTFGTILAGAESGNPAALKQFPQAAADFRRSAALSASYLTYLGQATSQVSFGFPCVHTLFRPRNFRVHVCIHAHMDIHR